MNIDYETWLIEESDGIIKKITNQGFDSLSSLDKALYNFWVVDYAIRNSGTLEPMREIHNNAIVELVEFARKHDCKNLEAMLIQDEKVFCDNYLNKFDESCKELCNLSLNGNK